MLKLIDVCKEYKNGRNKTTVLDHVNLSFGNNELVFILGPSGSGKSTLLNIIAGNLKCDSGSIWLGNTCISELSEKQINGYRSNIIGNVFQDYNLIDYMSVIDNIRLAYNGKKNQEIVKILKEVNMYDKKNMIVGKLSGGEKQRVAIARALVNNNHIILADEPTGALDSKMGIQIMDILKEASKKRLVIVVSHDNNLANKYATRIVNIKDGKCDSFNTSNSDDDIIYNYKTKRKRLAIMKLAFKNLWLKKIRTLFTSLAISLGIICMLLVGNLYYNFNDEIKNMEKEVVSVFPITINNGDFEILDSKVKSSNNKIIIKDRKKMIHTNVINNSYLDYLNSIEEIKYIMYYYDALIPFISDKYKSIDNNYLRVIPNEKYISDNFNILYGHGIQNNREVLIKVDSKNNLDSRLLNYFDIASDIEYSDIVGRKIKVIINDQYYIKNGNFFVTNSNINDIYNKSNITLTIVGVVKEKNVVDDGNYIYYNDGLLTEIFDVNSKSNIVNSQINSNYNVLGMDIKKEEMLSLLGYNSLPSSINIYVSNLSNKKVVLKYLDNYNKKYDKLIYVDTMSSAIDIVRQFISIISLILIMFSIIAIIISSLMVAILTNVRVLERKKEIGILRSLGNSKKDIKRLFNLENIIIGFLALLISFIVCVLMVKPLNNIIYNYLEVKDIFKINYGIMIIVFLINMFLIKNSGSIPVNRASKLDIVNCIYNK